MNIELIEATPNPEELVAKAARNDYRSDGVIDYTFEEIMEAVDAESEPKEGDFPNATIESKKRTLIDHLIDSEHWGPFEHPQATIAIEGVTRVSMAQITRHRHFTFDVMSLRYVGIEGVSDIEERFDIPEEVSGGEVATRHGVSELDGGVEEEFATAHLDAIDHYESLLDKGVPQEEARKVLPMATKVNIVMSGNARAWMHLLNIRGKANVQGEARRIADGIMDELQEWMPYTFTKYDEDVLPLKLNP